MLSTLTLSLALQASFAPPSPPPVRERLEAYLAEVLEADMLNGVVVVLDGETEVLSRAYGARDVDADAPNTLDTRFRIGSITKLFTGAAILRLVDREVLALDAPIASVRPALPHADRITLRQVLAFRSGLPNEPPGLLEGEGVEYDAEGFAGPFLESLEVELDFEPGSREAYSNLGYWYAGAVLETATGKSYPDAIRELVLAPLGLEDTAFGATDRRDSTGHERVEGRLAAVVPYSVEGRYASGAMSSTAADLVRFCRAFADDGFLGHESRDELFRRFRLDRRELTKDGGPVLTGSGFVPGWRSYLRFHPEEGHLAVVLNNQTVLPPSAIGDIGTDLVRITRGDAPRGFARPSGGLEMRDATDGLPDTPVARAARGYVDALGAADAEALVAWHREFMDDMTEDEIREQARRLFELPRRLGGWEIALYRENGTDELVLALRGSAPVDVLFTFRSSATEPVTFSSVEIGQARR